ncbi:MAG: ABC transporter ATP-binding protein [Bdellovibrionota bacterium]
MSPSPEVKSSATFAVQLKKLKKTFGSLAANEDVSLSVRTGSIHAVIGENGAGKSTAMKMLYGIYPPDSGEILIRGEVKKWRSPMDAIHAGIGMVHQHFMLADPYTALENVLVGDEPYEDRSKWIPRALRPISHRRARAKLEKLSEQYGLKVNWDSPVSDLPVGIQQRLEILKLLYRDAEILILDEPTAVLTPQEVTELFFNLKKLADEGKTILIITHKLKEVMAVADEITVLRAGKIAGQTRARNTTPDQLAEMMVGRKVKLFSEVPPPANVGSPVLKLSQLSLKGALGGAKDLLQGLSLELCSGEILGIAGVEGNGQSELLQILMDPADLGSRLSGEIELLGKKVLSSSHVAAAGEIRSTGVGVIPEDRIREGLLVESDLRQNFLLGLQRRAPFSKKGFLRQAELNRRVDIALEAYDVRPKDSAAIAGQLSGGNQQKLIIAREFERNPKLLIAAQPTRGVDVGAIESIHRRIFEAREQGAGVLLISSELEEIFALSDRILVIYEGKIVASFSRGEADEHRVGLAMSGAGVS